MSDKTYFLLWHPESDCLFWSDKFVEGDGLIEEIGTSNTPTRHQAQRMFERATERNIDAPKFEDVFKEKEMPKPVEPTKPIVRLFEAKPRWPGAPKICLEENLPAFDDEKQLSKFADTCCASGRIIKKWTCEFCQCLHFLTSSPAPSGDSSGAGRNAKKYQTERDNGTKRLG